MSMNNNLRDSSSNGAGVNGRHAASKNSNGSIIPERRRKYLNASDDMQGGGNYMSGPND